MTTIARLAFSLRPASLAVYHAARLAADCAANDNAGAAWQARDEAPAVDNCHLATLVMGRTVAAVFEEIAPEVDCTAWRMCLTRLGTLTTNAQGYLRIPIGVGLSVLLLGESVPSNLVLGLVLVMAGVAAMTVPAQQYKRAIAHVRARLRG